MVDQNIPRKLKNTRHEIVYKYGKIDKTDKLQNLLCNLFYIINTIRKFIVSLIFISYHQKFNLHIFSSFKTTAEKKMCFPHMFIRLCVEMIYLSKFRIHFDYVVSYCMPWYVILRYLHVKSTYIITAHLTGYFTQFRLLYLLLRVKILFNCFEEHSATVIN
jgi:DNA-directed RNA polymerase beta subunit